MAYNCISNFMSNWTATGVGVVVSLLIGLSNTYFNFLRGATYKVNFGCLKLIQLYTTGAKQPDNVIPIFLFTITNSGYQMGIVQDIRIILHAKNQNIESYPNNKIPIAAFEEVKPFEHGRYYSGIPFYPFSIDAKKDWISTFHFSKGSEIYSILEGGIADIEIHVCISGKWKKIFQDTLNGGGKALRIDGTIYTPEKGGSMESYYYPISRNSKRANS